MEINSLHDLHTIVDRLDMNKTIFRGVRDAKKHKLITSIGRKWNYKTSMTSGFPSYEKRIFKLFKEMSLPYVDLMPRSNMEWLILAQHHGLPTRLLDWTYNPLVAAYFAVEMPHDGDSAIYMYSGTQTLDIEKDTDPFSIKSVRRVRPPHFSERISAQSSVFTIHPKPKEIFEATSSNRVKVIIIKEKSRHKIKSELCRYNVGRAALFPGLDGIAKEIDWRSIELC